MEVLRRHGLNYPDDYTFNVVGCTRRAGKRFKREPLMRRATHSAQFIAEDAGFRNLGEVTDYISRNCFHGADRDGRWRRRTRWLGGVPKSPDPVDAWMDDEANDAPLAPVDGRGNPGGREIRTSVARLHAGETRFPARPLHSGAAFAKTVELMQKAGFPAADAARAGAVLDDSYRNAAAS